jgi:rhodanese-related sulfurtransferase
MLGHTADPSGETGTGLLKGAALVVLLGAALGIAQNALMRRAAPPQGLAWIAEEVVLDDLEAMLDEGANNGVVPGAPLPPVVDSPFAMAPEAAPDSDLPPIPDLGRPVQMQLPMVRQFQEAGGAVLVDVRDREEYRAGHIAGALSLPYDEAITDPARLERLDPGGKPIIVYCGGGTCETSMNMAFALIEAGKSRVLVYMGGFPEWQATGLPVESGEGRVVL